METWKSSWYSLKGRRELLFGLLPPSKRLSPWHIWLQQDLKSRKVDSLPIFSSSMRGLLHAKDSCFCGFLEALELGVSFLYEKAPCFVAFWRRLIKAANYDVLAFHDPCLDLPLPYRLELALDCTTSALFSPVQRNFYMIWYLKNMVISTSWFWCTYKSCIML